MGNIQHSNSPTPGYDDQTVIPTLQLQYLLDDLEEAVKKLVVDAESESLIMYSKEQIRRIEDLGHTLSYDLQHLSDHFNHHFHNFIEGSSEEGEVLLKLIREMRQRL